MKTLKAIAIFIIFGAVVSCTTTLTPKGSTIRVVETKENYDCKFIATVSGFDTLGANTGKESENSMNEARNKAAEIEANGIRVLHMQTTFQGTSVTVEALRCKFKD